LPYDAHHLNPMMNPQPGANSNLQRLRAATGGAESDAGWALGGPLPFAARRQ
jgi:hypothetical protein